MARSLGEALAEARTSAGFQRPDDAATAAGFSRDFIFKIERIGNRPNSANPTLDTLEKLANIYGIELGDCFPTSAPVSRDVQPLLDVLSDLPAEARNGLILQMAAMARSMSAAFKAALPAPLVAPADNVVQFPRQEEPVEQSDDALGRLVTVMKRAGAEPRKAAMGPEPEARFFGLASAGEGIELFEDIPAEHRQLPQYYWKLGARGVLKAVGDSMMDVGIFHNDLMFVKPTPEPPSGSIVICTLNRKVFVKTLKRNGNGQPVQLCSKNEAYAPIDIKPTDEVEFYGVVVGRTGDL